MSGYANRSVQPNSGEPYDRRLISVVTVQKRKIVRRSFIFRNTFIINMVSSNFVDAQNNR